jgi:ketosteroid isomerase-like protein
MKRVVVAAILIAVAFAGWRWYERSFAPEQQYHKFAEEMLKRHYDVAAAMTDGLSEADLGALGSQEKTWGGPAMFQTLFPSKFKIDSREVAADGSISLHAVQTVLFNPPGVESALRPAMYATMRQVVTLRKTAGGWKIASFENNVEKVESTNGR